MSAEAGPFLAALSVDEFLLVRQAGFRPVGLVVGVSVYRRPRSENPYGTGEFVLSTESVYAARQRAMSRLESEAGALGADGVIGVDLTWERLSADGLERLTAVGTAVVATDPIATARRNARGVPFTCTLGGREFWTLLRSGHVPFGVVVGLSDYLLPVSPDGPEPAEAQGPTSVIYGARDRVTSRIRAEAEELGADGVVDLAITGLPPAEAFGPTRMLAVGTAVGYLGEGADLMPDPVPTVALDS